jgi:organic hydroperoxide reductase OsmC/OhrA
MALERTAARVREAATQGAVIRTARLSWLSKPPHGHGQIIVGSRAFTAVIRFPSGLVEPESTDASELMAAAHAAAFASSLACILGSDGKPAQELVVSATYEHGKSWYELVSVEISVFGRVAALDAEPFERAAHLAAERCHRSFGLGAQAEITIHSALACTFANRDR